MTGPGIALATLPGPWGPVHVAATGVGVIAVEHGQTAEAFAAGLARRSGGPLVETTPARRRLGAVTPLLQLAIDGLPVDLSGIELDLRDRPAFDQRVLLAVREIPWGRTVSYGGIARQIGAPRAARAVGGAVGRNPVAFLVPCHRVIAADGTLGGYGGSGPTDRAAALERKRVLLLREGVTVPSRGD